MKTSALSADNVKKYSTSMGRHLSQRYGQAILISGYPVFTAVNWSQHWFAICVQHQFSCASKLARKCEIEHWYGCAVDERSVVRSVYGHVITKFSGIGGFTYPWCSAGARFTRARAPLKSVFHHQMKLHEVYQTYSASRLFSTLLSVFHLVMKHCVSCLIYYMNNYPAFKGLAAAGKTVKSN